MSPKIIPLSVPNISGNELKYVQDCLETGWISSVGSYVTEFEDAIAEYVGAKHAVATMNGTAALHIAQLLAGVKPGDYVIMPNITFVATANSIKYTGADPIFIDADPDNWQMDLDLLDSFLSHDTVVDKEHHVRLKNDNRIVRAIIPVHVQGSMFDMSKFHGIIKNYNITVIEDAAESLGTRFQGKHSGTFGQFGCFSFNGNKIISTGGGGMIVTDNDSLAQKAKHLTTTAKTDALLYHHDEVGYNYRLVNVLAAIGLAQVEQLPAFVARKQEIADFYRSKLEGVGDIQFQHILNKVQSNNWLFTIKTKYQPELLKFLNNSGIMSRPFWMPMHELPMYKNNIYISDRDHCSEIHTSCLSIPCSTNISNRELATVVNTIGNFYSGIYT
jgi:perosamine synthetase